MWPEIEWLDDGFSMEYETFDIRGENAII